MDTLSKRQEAILNYIKHYQATKNYPPSVREIGEAVGLSSTSTTHGHLARMEKKGYIRRDPTKPRTIEIVDGTEVNPKMRSEVAYAPHIGKVTAGLPITAIENIDEFIPIPSYLTNTETNTFALTIEGDSMIEAGIHNRDVVIVRQQNTANNGDIIVALTDDGEATVKRFFKEKDHIRLQPENSNMEPLLYKNITVLGKLVGLYRHIK